MASFIVPLNNVVLSMDENTQDVTEEQDALSDFLEQENETPEESSPESNETDTNPTPSGEEQESEPAQNEEEVERVPYSRFKEVNDDKKKLEEELQDLQSLREELDSLKSRVEPKEQDVELPPEFVELYGNDDLAKKEYLRRQAEFDSFEQRMLDKFENYQSQKQKEENEAIQKIQDGWMREMQAIQEEDGIQLTGDDEDSKSNRNKLLKIMEDYSESDAESFIPVKAAYAIMQAQHQPQSDARKSVAKAVSGGETKAAASSVVRIDGWADI